MKLIRIVFLISSLIAILVIPSSSLLLNPYYSSPIKQDLDDKIMVKALHRKLMIIPDEHANMMTSTHHEGSSQEVGVTSSGKLNYEKEEKLKREEEKSLTKYLSMDYPKFRRRRPVHNKALPRALRP